MKNKYCLLVLCGVIGLMTCVPHFFDVPYPMAPNHSAQLGGRAYYATYVDYSSLFDPFCDFARQMVGETRTLPIWNTYALMGLPIIEQSDHALLNPLQWFLWLGDRDWRIIGSCLYLIWGAWGAYLLMVQRLGFARWLSLGASLAYALTGAAPHALGYFSCLMHIMCLPHILNHASCLTSVGTGRIRHTALLVGYITILLLSGQPQYLLVSGLAVGAALALFAILTRRPWTLLLYAAAAMIALLLAAPALLPFIEANLLNHAYPGNHQLVGSSSYWKVNFLTFSQLFCHRLPGFVGTTWYLSNSPASQISYESLPIAFGGVGIAAALIGSVSSLRHACRRRLSRVGSLRCAIGLTALGLLGFLLFHNLSAPQTYPWAFRFVNLTKYSAPILALLLCLAVPEGLHRLTSGPLAWRLLLNLIPWLIPVMFLGLLYRIEVQINDANLLRYCLAVTFSPLILLAWVAFGKTQLRPGFRMGLLATVVIMETVLLCSWGMPFPFEWVRFAAVLFAGALLLVIRDKGVGLVAPTLAAVIIIGLLLVAGRETKWNGPDTARYNNLHALSEHHERAYGYKPRFLASEWMIDYPTSAVHRFRTLVSRCPVIPLPTQALLFDYVEPRQLAETQRRLSFLEFHGAVAPEAEGYLSWSHFAAKPELLDLLGIDYVLDFATGPLAARPELLNRHFNRPLPAPDGLFLRGREIPSGKASFFPRFSTVPFTNDAWAVRQAWRMAGKPDPSRPVVEIDYRTAPKWEGMVRHAWFESEQPASSTATVAVAADRNGYFSAMVSSTGPGLLVFREQYWDGWEARINGERQPVLRVNSLFQGVLLPGAGNWQVTYRYEGTVRRDLLFTIVGLLAAILLILELRRQARATPLKRQDTLEIISR